MISIVHHNLAQNLDQLMVDLVSKKSFADVILVTDDNIHISAHKFILSHYSSVFQKILSNNFQQPYIYLRGVLEMHLEPILNFIYRGDVSIHKDLLQDTLRVAKDLDFGCFLEACNGFEDETEILADKVIEEKFSNFDESEITNDTDKNEQSKMFVSTNNFVPTSDCKMLKLEFEVLENTSSELSEEPSSKHIDEAVKMTDPLSVALNNRVKKRYRSNQMKDIDSDTYTCHLCDLKFKSSTAFKYHKNAKHIGKTFPCDYCELDFKSKSNLVAHIRNIHDGVKFPCKFCSFKATQANSLKRHIASKHSNV